MIAKNDIFATILRKNGHSITKTRQAVFAALDTDGPITMHTLIERCNNIDRASVYRSITLFEQTDIVRRIYTGWKYKIELSDRFGLHHHHATCNKCGQTILLEEDTALESSLRRLAEKHSFTITGHEIEITGQCQHCTIELSESHTPRKAIPQ